MPLHPGSTIGDPWANCGSAACLNTSGIGKHLQLIAVSVIRLKKLSLTTSHRLRLLNAFTADKKILHHFKLNNHIHRTHHKLFHKFNEQCLSALSHRSVNDINGHY